MTRYEYKTNKILSYVWLAVAIAAIAGAFLKGAWHQLLVAGISVLMFLAMHPRKWVHIPGEIYNNLNLKISTIISEMEDDFKHTSVEEDVDDVCVNLEIELHARKTKCKFSDNAWGIPMIHTETNFNCDVKIIGVEVTYQEKPIVNTDFDEDRISTYYEVTEWS